MDLMFTIGIVLFGTLLALLFLGVPVSVCLGFAAIPCLLILDVPLAAVPQRIFTALDGYAIMAIPFFVLAGNLMTSGGISRRLVEFVNAIIGRVRGGMAYAVVLACTFFASMSGSAPATVVAIGGTMYPEIIKLGYPKARCAGLLAVAGGMGPITPPSIIMVVYATITNCSITNLFSAGIIAGALVFVALMITCSIYARRENWPKNTTPFSAMALLKTGFSAIWAFFLPVIILGGIYSGWLTPTEAAAAAVVYAFIAGCFIYREIPLLGLPPIIIKSAKASAMVLFIVAASTAFSWVFTMSGLSGALVEAIKAMNMTAGTYCILTAFILLFFGIFIEGIACCVLLVPVLWPIADSLGVMNVHFGMIVCISNVMGTMTPPVAVNLFAASSVSGLKMGEIVRGELPFFAAFSVAFFIMVLFPSLSTFFIQ